MMLDKRRVWRSVAGQKTDWKALGGTEKKEDKQPAMRVEGAVNSPSAFFSLPLTPCLLLQHPRWRAEPLHQPIRQLGFVVATGSERLLVISPPLSTRSVVPFQASASLSRRDYIQSHGQQDGTTKQTQPDVGEEQGQRFKDPVCMFKCTN